MIATKPCILLAIFFSATCFGYSQGTVAFQNRNSAAGIDAPISYAGGGPKPDGRIDGAAAGSTAMAGLFAGPDGASESDLVLIEPPVNFRSGIAAGYVNVGTAASRSIPDVAPGAFAMVQIRAWDTFGFPLQGAASGYFGRSAILRVATGGSGNPPAPAANLIGLQAFDIRYVPEPGTIALAILGCAGALLLMRREE